MQRYVPPRFAGDAGLGAGGLDHARKFSTDRIGKTDVGHQSVAEKRVDAVAGAIEELVGNDEIQRLMLFFQRSDGGNRNDAFDSQLLEAVNVGAEI